MKLNYEITDGYIDSHCHLADPRIENLNDLLTEAQSLGITHFLMAGLDPADWKRQLEIAQTHKGLIPCFGIHPYRTAKWSELECDSAFNELSKLLDQSFALGELGLDFRKQFLGSEERQIKYFRDQIELALSHKKALVLHIVQAHPKAQEILREYKVPLRGMVHAFSGSFEVAKVYLDLGLYISIGGAVSFEKNRKLREAVAKIPDDRLLLETDSPDQAPIGWEHKLNSPSSLIVIADEVAKLRGKSKGYILETSRNNFVKLFS